MRTRETILNHPPGLYFLTFTEMWERFSYYGMTPLLMLGKRLSRVLDSTRAAAPRSCG